GGTAGHAVEPVADPLARPDGSGLAHEDEEGGLEGVLRVMSVTKQPAAHAQHHRPVPAHQRRERFLVAPDDEAVQELTVRKTAGVAQKSGPAQTPKDAAHQTRRHVLVSAAWRHQHSFPSYWRATGRTVQNFFSILEEGRPFVVPWYPRG